VETAQRIARARDRLASVVLPDAELRRIAAVCAAFDVDGMRADLVIARASTAHAAWRGADTVAKEDVRAAARLALPHRRRRDPFDEPGMDEQALDEALDAADPEPEPEPDGPEPDGREPDGPEPDGPGDGAPDDAGPDGANADGSAPDGPADTRSGDRANGRDTQRPEGGA